MITALLTGSLLALGGFSAGAQETGLQVQKSSERKDAWLNDSANPESKKWRHSFKVTGFFVNKYGIRLAWNNDSSLYQTTRQITAGDVYTVSFIEEMKQYADDPEVLEAIRLAILEERKTEENSTNQWVTNFIMTNPVVVGRVATFTPFFCNSFIRYSVCGVLPVPPTARLPTHITGTSKLFDRSQPQSKSLFRKHTPIP